VTFDIDPAGTDLRYPDSERVQSRRGVTVNILPALRLIRAKQRVKRIDKLACALNLRSLQVPRQNGPETAAAMLAADLHRWAHAALAVHEPAGTPSREGILTRAASLLL